MVLQFLSQDEQFSGSISFNWKAIVVGLLLTASLVGGAYFWHDIQVKRNTPLVLAEAKLRQAKGEDASALAYYETYLGYRPNDLSALAEHALLKTKLATSAPAAAEAFFTLARAIYYIPDRQDLRRELVQLGVRLRRVHDCQKELEWLLDAAPEDPEVRRLAAHAAVQQREFETARTHYQRFLKLDPSNVRASLEYLHLLSSELKDFEAADALLNELLARHPDDGSLQSVAAGYYYDRGRLDLSEKHLVAALKHDTSPKAALYNLQSEIARLRRRPRELEASLVQLAEFSDNDRRVEMELAEVELSIGRRLAAHTRLMRIARDPKASAEELWQCYLLLAGSAFADDLPEVMGRLKERDAEGPYLISLAMRDRMIEGDWSGALELSRGLMKRINLTAKLAAQLSLWRADCFEKVGGVEDMLNALQRAVTAEPRAVEPRRRFARLLLENGRTQDAQTQYALLLTQSPRFAAEFVQLLRDSLSPNSPFRLTRMDVDRVFENWRESAPDSPLPLLCRIDLLQQLSESDAAEELIAEGLKRWPHEAGFHLARIERLGRAGQWTKALEQLEDADKSCGLQPALLIARVECLIAAAPADLDSQLETCVEAFGRLERDGQALVLPVLVRSLRQANVDPALVKSLAVTFNAVNPNEPMFHLQAISQAMNDGDFEAVRRPLEELRATLGEDAPLYRLAAAMVDQSAARAGDPEAIAKIRSALEQLDQVSTPPSDTIVSIKVSLALIGRQPSKALHYLQEALKSGDIEFTTLTRTLTLMAAMGQFEQCTQLIKELLAASRESPDDASKKYPPELKNVETLRAALEPLVDQSWPLALVAYRLDLQEDAHRAAETLARADKIAPTQALVAANRLAYVERFAPAELSELVAELERKLSLVDQARLLPPFLSRLKREADAEKLLEEARADAPDNPDVYRAQVNWMRSQPRADAVKLAEMLTAMLNTDSPAQAACRQVARLELARLWSSNRDYRLHRKALELAADALKEDATSEEAQLLQLDLLVGHPGEWVAALEGCRKLAESPQLKLRLAALFRESLIHERRKTWDEERRVLIALRELQPENPQWLLRLMLNAVHRQDREAVAELRKQLPALAPDADNTLRGDVLASALADDRSEIVSRVLAAHQEGKLSVTVAEELLNLLRAPAEREKLLKDAANLDTPITLARYARFLGTQNRISEAIEIGRELWDEGYRELAAEVVSDLVGTTAITVEEAAEFRELIIQEAAKEDAGVRMQLAAATVADHAGQSSESQRFYRQTLQKSPDNVVALNNSAYLAVIGESKFGDDSLKNIKRAIEIAGPVAQLLDTYGVLLLRRGDSEGALEQLSVAWEQAHDPAHGTHLAWALTELGRFDEAAQLFSEVDRVEPKPRFHPLERDRDAAYRAKAKAGASEP